MSSATCNSQVVDGLEGRQSGAEAITKAAIGPASSSGVVFVVEEEQAELEYLEQLLRLEGYAVAAFNSAGKFLRAIRPGESGCLVMSLHIWDMSGLDMQEFLAKAGASLQVVCMDGCGDVASIVRAMKAGALDVLTKPINTRDLLEAVRQALEIEREERKHREELAAIRAGYAMLTPREQEVCLLVVSGLLNKQIAAILGTCEKTVKVHRARVMRKMQATSLAELVRMADKAGLQK